HFVAAKRLAASKLTVIDATNVQPEARKSLFALAREYHCLVTAIVFNLPEQLCQERNRQRPDRNFGPHVVHQQSIQLRRSVRHLREEGFHSTTIFTSPEQVNTAEIERQPLWTNLKHEHGPFDIIGDVHGCFDELHTLLIQSGYEITCQEEPEVRFRVSHPQKRKVVFLGDLVDRGPATPNVLRLAMDMVSDGIALCVPGNHDMKLLRKLKGRDVRMTHGIAESLAQLEQEAPVFKNRVITFLDSLISHYVLDDGKLVVTHAGMKEAMQGRSSRAVRDFALYGETTGEVDELGLPVRYNWAAEYRGKALVVYGHTTVPEPEWLNRTINIDTGCVFGGRLTALRYPEKELVSVQAARVYREAPRPFLAEKEQAPALTAQQQHDDVLDIDDVVGKRIISTRLLPNIIIREENATAALEVMSRFAANPKWLIYLPPTMSPCETSKEPGLLEHPAEAFAYYRREGIAPVVCEQKHMGSRIVVIVCRDEDVARTRFGVTNEGIGICYTRTGRRFFDAGTLETELLTSLRSALDEANFWEQFRTDWVCLDGELMPWSVKAQNLLLQQYAAVGAASRVALGEAVTLLEKARQRGQDTSSLLDTYRRRQALAAQYVEAYRLYCWPVSSLTDIKLAPFHLLATQGTTYFERDHTWHMNTLAQICRANSQLLLATPYLMIDVTDEASMEQGVSWWRHVTAQGGEGMVVKPLQFIVRGQHGLIQPAVKCRGPEYLRIIYGPEYDVPENLERLRFRGLSTKRSLALREFALGVEALERFVHAEPLRRVHECVFGVLAMESEPVDPRL
ncbi:MAG: polynucleotide kinase-phosphatase, partial [Ktedonobacteraceae bacterium]|nr:polynucleotide kinase-phosphatase [Ktedonobacteraceae bacterium]